MSGQVRKAALSRRSVVTALVAIAVCSPVDAAGLADPASRADAASPPHVSGSASPVDPTGRAVSLFLDRIPADVVAAYIVPERGPSDDTGGPKGVPAGRVEGLDAMPVIASLVDQAERMGLFSELDDCALQWVDSLLSVSTVLGYPHAGVLLGVSASARSDGGHELAGLHAAIIVQTRGDHDGLADRIRHLLNTYANTEESALTTEVVGSYSFFCLRDRRLPPWATIRWGLLGDSYVVAIGEGTVERLVGEADEHGGSLGADPWVTSGLSRMADGRPGLVAYTRFDELGRGEDAPFSEKVNSVKRGLGLAGVERALWTVGRRGRAVEVKALLRRDGRDELVAIAGDDVMNAADRAFIPAGAAGYTAVDAEPLDILRGACAAYLASRGPEAREDIRAFWRELEARSGVSVERDIVSQLGGPIIIHDFPRHALKLPLAWTVVVPVTGDATLLRRNIDRLAEVVGRELADGSLVRLQRSPDGVWYVRYGLAGPAMTVTDRWLIVSFSPRAVMENAIILAPDRAGGGPRRAGSASMCVPGDSPRDR